MHKTRKSIKNTRGYISLVLIGIALFAFLIASGFINNVNPTPDGTKYILATPTPYGAYNSLELHTLDFISVKPSPLPSVPAGNACANSQFNTEQKILLGSDPAPGGAAGTAGKIRVWVNDESAPYISPKETVDQTTGQITVAGTRTAKDTSTDGGGNYLWEPSVYMTNLGTDPSPIGNKNGIPVYKGDAENGGTPYFPSTVKGNYNTADIARAQCGSLHGSTLDTDYVNFENGPDYQGKSVGTNLPFPCTAEFIWDVSTLRSSGLSAGTYRAEYIIHDGDVNLAINCTTVQL